MPLLDEASRDLEPALSTDARWAYFSRGADLDVAGGPPPTTEILRSEVLSGEQQTLLRGDREVRQPVPSEDGERLLFISREQLNDAPGRRLYVMPTAGGEWQRLVPEDDELLANYDVAVWRPNGDAVTYVRSQTADDGSVVSEIREVDVASGAVQTLHRAPKDALIGGLSWTDDGSSLLFSELTVSSAEDRDVTTFRWTAETGRIFEVARNSVPAVVAHGEGFIGIGARPDAEGAVLFVWAKDGAEPIETALRSDDGPIASTTGPPALSPCLVGEEPR
ncbi:MAG: TolB family protein [Geodermatophilaceae bacterium]